MAASFRYEDLLERTHLTSAEAEAVEVMEFYIYPPLGTCYHTYVTLAVQAYAKSFLKLFLEHLEKIAKEENCTSYTFSFCNIDFISFVCTKIDKKDSCEFIKFLFPFVMRLEKDTYRNNFFYGVFGRNIRILFNKTISAILNESYSRKYTKQSKFYIWDDITITF